MPPAARTCDAELRRRLSDIYRQHASFVARSTRKLGVDEGQVDDVVQDVFVVAHRRLADFEGRSSIRTWLFGITLRVIKDYRRRAFRCERRLAALGSPEPVASVEEAVTQNRALREIDQVLAELEESQRTVFVMAEIEGHTAPEISNVLALNLNTVYSRLRLARRKLPNLAARVRVAA